MVCKYLLLLSVLLAVVPAAAYEWRHVPIGGQDFPVFEIEFDAETAYAGTDIGVFCRSESAGAWEGMGLDYPALEAHDFLFPGDNSIHCAFHDSIGISWSDGVYRWNGLPGNWEVDWWCPRPFLIQEHPLVPGTFYCGTIDGLYTSTDLQAWTAVGAGQLPGNVRCLWFHPTDAARLLAGTGAGLYRTTDGGTAWSIDPEIPPLPVMDLEPGWDAEARALRLFAAVGDGSYSDGLFRSDDFGSSFTRITYLFRPTDLIPDPAAQTALQLLAGTMEGGVVRVGLDGTLLGDLNVGLPCLTIHRLAGDPLIDTPAVYACTAGGLEHCLLLEPNTVSIDLACDPPTGTVPFPVQLAARLSNLTDRHRLEAGRVDILLASGSAISNWRHGHTRLSPGETRMIEWSVLVPALAAVVGENRFTLHGLDVTPPPYNQPPYPPSGDGDTAECTVIALK